MTDLLSWLRSALDEHERIALAVDERGYLYDTEGCSDASIAHFEANDPAHVLRTVAAHREILGWVMDRQQPGSTVGDDYWFALVVIVGIYRESHPGFDPSWIGES